MGSPVSRSFFAPAPFAAFPLLRFAFRFSIHRFNSESTCSCSSSNAFISLRASFAADEAAATAKPSASGVACGAFWRGSEGFLSLAPLDRGTSGSTCCTCGSGGASPPPRTFPMRPSRYNVFDRRACGGGSSHRFRKCPGLVSYGGARKFVSVCLDGSTTPEYVNMTSVALSFLSP